MSLNIEELRKKISSIEPNDSMFQDIGPSDIPALELILQDEEPWIACRAIFVLSTIQDDKIVQILSQAANDPRPEVRVAVSASMSNLLPADSSNLLTKLLGDNDAGVRKFAIQSVSIDHQLNVLNKIDNIIDDDPIKELKEMAKMQRNRIR